jgi:hypothetical protein
MRCRIDEDGGAAPPRRPARSDNIAAAGGSRVEYLAMHTTSLKLILVVWVLLCLATTASAVCLNVYFVRLGGTPGAGTQQDPANTLPMFLPGGFDVLYMLEDGAAMLDPDSSVVPAAGAFSPH